MTTAQDQQSRELLPCPFCGREAMMSHSRDGEVCNVRCAGWSVGNCLGAGPNCYTEADAVAGWNRRAPAVQAARALPAGMEPLCYLRPAAATTPARAWQPRENDGTAQPVYTADQVQAMGRVPPGWQAVPVEPTTEMVEAAAEAHMPFGDMALAIQSAIAAAPQPPAAPATTGAQPPTTGAGSATAGAAPAYRLLQRDIDTIQADDEFLRDDAVTWQADPQGIFVGMAYMSNVLRPARRAIESGQEIK